MNLKEKFKSKIEPWRAKVKTLIKKYGDVKISNVTVAQVFGGMRNINCIITETSSVDPDKGVCFRQYRSLKKN